MYLYIYLHIALYKKIYIYIIYILYFEFLIFSLDRVDVSPCLRRKPVTVKVSSKSRYLYMNLKEKSALKHEVFMMMKILSCMSGTYG